MSTSRAPFYLGIGAKLLVGVVLVAATGLQAQTPTVQKASNVAASSAGARLVTFSSQGDSGSWAARNLLDGKSDVGWRSPLDRAGPQSFVVELPADVLLTRVSFDNSGENSSAREVRLSVSVEAVNVGYRDVGAFTLNKGEVEQGFRLSAPARARWIKLIIASNNGDGRQVSLMDFRAFGLPARLQTVEDETGFRALLSAEVLFDAGLSTLRADAEKALSEALAILLEFPSAKVRVEGHTDSTGAAVANKDLSLARANSVRDWFDENRGSARWTIETLGAGSTKPVSSNGSPNGRQRNRRVEITVLR